MRTGLRRRFYKRGVPEVIFRIPDPRVYKYEVLLNGDSNIEGGETARLVYKWALLKKYKTHIIRDAAIAFIYDRFINRGFVFKSFEMLVDEPDIVLYGKGVHRNAVA